MHEWIIRATEVTVLGINALVVLFIIVGTAEVCARSGLALLGSQEIERSLRDSYMRYARWLIGALTLQLAADIAETAVAPTWDAVGQLGVVAAIRTALNYFLERDLHEMRKLQEDSAGRTAGAQGE